MEKLIPPNATTAATADNNLSHENVAQDKKASASLDLDYERNIQEALASLQLPHMPVAAFHQLDDRSDQNKHPSSSTAASSTTHSRSHTRTQQQQQQQQLLPSITIMVCADIDLQSTSALAEYTLQQKNRVFDANAIDLIIAVGPCARDTDLLRYCQGSGGAAMGRNSSASSSNRQQRTNGRTRRQRMQQASQQQHTTQPQYYSGKFVQHFDNAMVPFFRTREESAALEGLVTAALSQLESVVCRVVYCPGWQDPLTVLQPPQRCSSNSCSSASSSSCMINNNNTKRLTPNSRNLHQQWLPLAPGLGCAGLFFLDGTEQLAAEYRNLCSYDAPNNNNNTNNSNDDDSDASEEQDSMTILSEQLKKLQQWYVLQRGVSCRHAIPVKQSTTAYAALSGVGCALDNRLSLTPSYSDLFLL